MWISLMTKIKIIDGWNEEEFLMWRRVVGCIMLKSFVIIEENM